MVLYNTSKKKISDIRDEVGFSGFTENLIKDRLRREWTPTTDLFTERWGKGFVPHGLRPVICSV